LKRLAAALTLAAVAAIPLAATAQDRPQRSGRANPSAVIAAELAFARLARDKGQWTAFRETAADDAVMFVPQRVNAREWLRKRADPAESVRWQPHAVWMSCDGSLAVTRGAWQQADGRQGYFTTVWRPRKKGGYEWVMDQGDGLAEPLPAPEMISASVAACERVPPVERVAAIGQQHGSASTDRSLQWAVSVDARCGRIVTVRINRGGSAGFEDVLNARVVPPASPASCPP